MSAGNAPQSFEVRTLTLLLVRTTLHPRVARESSMAAHAGIPVLNMPDMLRDPVSALAGREVPVSVLQEQAVSFLHGCHICLAHLSRQVLTGKPERHVPVAHLPRSLIPRCYSMFPIVSLRAVQPSRAGMYTGPLVRQLSFFHSNTHTSMHSLTRRARWPSLCRRRQSDQRCPCISRSRSLLRSSLSRRSCWRSLSRGRGSSSCIWTMMRASYRHCVCRHCQPFLEGCQRTCVPGGASASTNWRHIGALTVQQRSSSRSTTKRCTR